MSVKLMALFQGEDEFIDAARKLKAAGFDELTLMSPIPMEATHEVQGLDKSPVRRFSLAGALLGAVGGFALAAGTALVFIIPRAGGP